MSDNTLHAIYIICFFAWLIALALSGCTSQDSWVGDKLENKKGPQYHWEPREDERIREDNDFNLDRLTDLWRA